MKKTHIVFMGTPDFAVPILEMLISMYQVDLVVTQPDKLVGRNHILTAPPIKKASLEHHIPVFQPTNIKTDYQKILEQKPDIIITCAYGQILPKEILEFPLLGCINVHASLLPKYRGGAPIHKAIINGESKTGITIMYMGEGMDDGDIITSQSIPILKEDNVGSLHDKLSSLGASLLKETLPIIIKGENQRISQNEADVTFAYNIKREEEHLDFSKKGQDIINQIRGLNPWPTANLLLNGEEFKILEAYFVRAPQKHTGIIKEINKESMGITCQDGIIYITKLKPFGKKIMATKDYLNGVKKETIINQRVK